MSRANVPGAGPDGLGGGRPRRGRGRLRLRAALTAGAAAVMLLGACTALPEAGDPAPFEVTVPTVDPLDLSAEGPAAGSTPKTLVGDFLRACAAGASDDFATARQYLTSDAADAWRPDARVEVFATDTAPEYATDPETAPSGTTSTPEGSAPPGAEPSTVTVAVTAQAVATLDDRGIFTRADSGSVIRHDFVLEQVDGEWRIHDLEDGVVVSQASFTTAYQQVDLFFPAVSGDELIPDPRWYPARRLATYLLTGLVDGPSDAIAPAVRTAVPAGASLPSQTVVITDKVAQVDLLGAYPADPESQSLLAWQVTRTLTQASTVSTVDLTVSGTQIDTTDVPQGPTYLTDSAIAVSDDGLVQVTGSAIGQAVVPVAQLGDDPRQPASGPVASPVVAWLGGAGATALDTATGQRAELAAPDALWPSVDRLGWVWVGSSVADAGIQVFSVAGETVQLEPPFQDGSTVRALRISLDGARAVLLRESGGISSVWVAPVLRDDRGQPTGLGQPTAISGVGSGVSDVTWAGRTTLVALRATAAGSGMEMAVVPLRGFITTLGVPEGAQWISAGSAPTSVYLTTEDGQIYQRSGSVWQSAGSQTRDLRFPG